MVWPTSWERVAIGGNVRLTLRRGQRERYQFMKGLPQSRVFRSEMDMRERARVATAEAQYPRNFLTASLHPRPGGRYAPSHVAGFVQRCSCRIRSRQTS